MPARDDSVEADRPTVELNLILGLTGVVAAIAVAWFRPALPYQVTGPLGLSLLLAAMACWVWLLARAVVASRVRRPRLVVLPVVVTVLMTGLVFVAARPEQSAYSSIRCVFGLYGFGKTQVWVRVSPDDDQVKEEHTLRIRWGGSRATVVEPLPRDTAFIFHKQDWFSPAANASIEPDADLTCGSGDPPDGARRIEVDRDRWTRTS